MSSSDMKTQLDTANAAIKLLEPFLQRSDQWRFGQRLVAGAALIGSAVTLVLGISSPSYTAAAVLAVMGISFLTRERNWSIARHIAVKDAKGKIRAVLTATEAQPVLAFLDASGVVRLRCGLNPEGIPSLTLLDGAAQPRLVVMTEPTTGPAVALLDTAGRPRVQLALSPEDQSGMVALINDSGIPMFQAFVSKDRSAIAGRDSVGKVAWTVPA